MNYSVADIESDGLLDEKSRTQRAATKIHCMSIRRHYNDEVTVFTLIDYDQMRDFLGKEEVIVGHNFIRFDKPLLEKILGIKIKARIVDTLALSWYLYPRRKDHNLENWGEDVGVAKPPIGDWMNLSIEEYIFRCESDTEINDKIFDLMIDYLFRIYGEPDAVNRLINYLMFKMDCAREQEEVRWLLNVKECEKNLAFLEAERIKKVEILTQAMPPQIEYKIRSRPDNLYKKDNTLSKKGESWLELLKSLNLPDYTVGPLKVEVGREPGNPGSIKQIKDWLFSLGWIPESFNYVKEKDKVTKVETGVVRKVPQITNDQDEICDSVKELFEQEPKLEVLEGLSILKHRIGILSGFLERRSIDDYLKAEVKGFTNTLRFQHTTIVNLPTLQKYYGELIRGCLIAPEGYELCGSDMSSLEESTKHHYMMYYDPEYVALCRKPGFDPHLDIALEAGLVTADDIIFYKAIDKKKKAEELITPEEKERYSKIKAERDKSKKVNFGAVYGAGVKKLALTGKFSMEIGRILHTAYWKRNGAVKKIAEGCTVKTIGDQMWLHNPVSQLWYTLRSLKDRFSTLNQGTGVYCFDTQVRNVRKQGVKMCGQFHDEFIIPLPLGHREELTTILNKAIEWTNQELQLKITLGISIDFGNSYAEIH